jgi:phospholipid/cholesterol/gamma-HCH transport system substrate-binding protein
LITFAPLILDMKFSIPNEVKIALLAIAAIVALVFGYNYLKGRGSFGSNRTFFAKYDNAQGLTEGSFVQLHGVTIGTVRKISLSPNVLVEFNISDKTINVPSDSKMVVLSDGLIGAKILGLTPGVSSTFLKEKDTLQSYSEIGMLDKLQADAGPILKNVDGVITKADGVMLKADGAITTIDNTVANVNSLLDANTKANLQSSIAGLNRSVQDFNQLSSTLAQQRQKIANTIAALETFANNLNKNNAMINSTLANVEGATKKLGEADLAGTINNLKTTLAQLDGTMGKINNNQGTLGMLINDKKLYNDMQGSLHSLDALLADLKARPGRYISFSVFGKKNKSDEPAPVVPQ